MVQRVAMGAAITRQRMAKGLIAACAGLAAMNVQGLTPGAPTLEQQAQSEFTLAGIAMRQRLDREAVGDLLGARIAMHDAESHRFRYLDLTREINRLHAPPEASPPVAAQRDPFTPDGAFLSGSAPVPNRTARKSTGVQQESPAATPYRSWDMYRTRISIEEAGMAGAESLPLRRAVPAEPDREPAKDMYAKNSDEPTPGDGHAAQAAEVALLSTDKPRQPYLVYREGRVATGPRR